MNNGTEQMKIFAEAIKMSLDTYIQGTCYGTFTV
jgi:hypothetical protein